jgi:uncharacterized protein YggL (DUF469 family)
MYERCKEGEVRGRKMKTRRKMCPTEFQEFYTLVIIVFGRKWNFDNGRTHSIFRA